MNTYQDRDFDEADVTNVTTVYSEFEYQVGSDIVVAAYASGFDVGAGVTVDERAMIERYWAERLN
jgi:hypothetical protein